jgi:hypothetical protein
MEGEKSLGFVEKQIPISWSFSVQPVTSLSLYRLSYPGSCVRKSIGVLFGVHAFLVSTETLT